MPDRKVGILIVAKDLTAKAMKGVALGAKGAWRSVQLLSKSISGTGAAFGDMMTRYNQTLEIVGKLRGALDTLVLSTAEAALGFRTATDPMVEWAEGQRREIELISARIGDVFLPLLKGISDAISEVTGVTSEWVQANRDLIATRLIEYFAPISKIFVGFVRGVEWVTKATLGLKATFELVRLAFSELSALILTGLAKRALVVGQFTEALGLETLSDKARAAGGALADMAAEARKGGDEATDRMMALGNEIEAIGEKADSAVAVIQRVTKRAQELARENLANDKGGADRKRDEIEAVLKWERRKQQALSEMRLQRVQWANEDREAAKADAAATAASWGSATASMASSMGTAFASMMADQRSFAAGLQAVAQVAINTALDVAQRLINVYAAEAAAAAFAGSAGVPLIGVALGAAAASTALGLVKAYANKMALGGEVRGGIPGRDSVPTLLMPGERVLTPSEARRETAGERQAGSGAPVITINLSQQALVPDADLSRRLVGDLSDAIEEAFADGRLRMGAR